MSRKFSAVLIFSSAIIIVLAFIMASVSGFNKPKKLEIGIVNVNPGPLENVVTGFKSGMEKSGYHAGGNVAYIYRSDIGISDTDAALKDLVKRKVDLILVVTTPVAQKAREAVQGTGIPVVFAPALYPAEAGLVKSLTHPGGDFTGIQAGGSAAKALEWHLNAVPGSKCLFVPWKSGDEVAAQSLFELRKAAAKFGVRLKLSENKTMGEFKAALENIPDGVDAIWLLNSPFLVSNVNLFVRSALRHKLPLSSATSQCAAGVMLSYGPRLFRTGEQAAGLAQRILEGVPPAELPVETSEFFLGVNLRTARAIGLEIPKDILLQADEIIR